MQGNLNIFKSDFTILWSSSGQIAVIWDSKKGRNWYIGFYLDTNKDGTHRIDHLERKGPKDDSWCRPKGKDDVQDADEIQILPINVVGDWNFNDEIRPTFIVTNLTDILDTYTKGCNVFDA